MCEHLNANGKKACRLDPVMKTVEIVHKNFKVLVQFNIDNSATVINYDLEGKPTILHYPAITTPK